MTFVAYILADGDKPAGKVMRARVRDRSISDLYIPKHACAFYFYDSPVAVTFDTPQPEENASRVYLLAEELLDRNQIKARIIGNKNIRPEDVKNVQWDPRIEKNDLFIITRGQGVQPVTKRHAVLNIHGRQLWPDHPVAGPVQKFDWAEAFSPALEKDLIVFRKPVKFLSPKRKNS